MTSHILLIDDDRELATLVTEFLGPQGYEITHALDGELGLSMARARSYDLILLDVMMPKLDGFDVLRQLRPDVITPVLMLTARGDDLDRILGLEMGADDYLPKPFNPRELAARIKALLRRQALLTAVNTPQVLSSPSVILDPSRQSVSCEGKQVMLTGTEFATLQLLMQRAGTLVSKEVISEQVLGRKLAPFDRSIDMHISNLRKKLSDTSSTELIRTVRGSGYLFLESLQ
ncbi:response regulator transcription factor [Aestuariibacter salexigens]|uniref:response regulator transcription factor n=1 Tax=Aestuariibacter salexigens TaxID=226010 RepID=UPI000409869A|nr:response regulator transcription factor [Aestuariibacter salexigens]